MDRFRLLTTNSLYEILIRMTPEEQQKVCIHPEFIKSCKLLNNFREINNSVPESWEDVLQPKTSYINEYDKAEFLSKKEEKIVKFYKGDHLDLLLEVIKSKEKPNIDDLVFLLNEKDLIIQKNVYRNDKLSGTNCVVYKFMIPNKSNLISTGLELHVHFDPVNQKHAQNPRFKFGKSQSKIDIIMSRKLKKALGDLWGI